MCTQWRRPHDCANPLRQGTSTGLHGPSARETPGAPAAPIKSGTWSIHAAGRSHTPGGQANRLPCDYPQGGDESTVAKRPSLLSARNGCWGVGGAVWVTHTSWGAGWQTSMLARFAAASTRNWCAIMAECVIEKGPDGKLRGFGEKGARAFARFQAAVRGLDAGDTIKFAFWLPRSPGFHRRHFKILAAVFAQQEQFLDPEKFREWLQVGAGYCDILPGPKGRLVAISRSIAWEKLDDADFEAHHTEVIRFMRSPHATRFLWPMMSDLQADTCINNILAEYST